MELHCSDDMGHNHHPADNVSISATIPFTIVDDGVPRVSATQNSIEECLRHMQNITNDCAPFFRCSTEQKVMYKHFNTHGTPFLCSSVEGNSGRTTTVQCKQFSERYHIVQLFHIFNAEFAAATIYDSRGYAIDKCLIQANELFLLDSSMKGDVLCVIGQPVLKHAGQMVLCLPAPDILHAVIRWWNANENASTVELFAGIGGWSFGAMMYAHPLTKGTRLIAVDKDLHVLKTFQKNHGGTIWDLKNFEDYRNCISATDPILLCCDFQDKQWWSLLFWLPCVELRWSAPCPPWSKGADSRGLDCWEGMIIMDVGDFIKVVQPHHACGENVASLIEHRHWHEVREHFGHTGMYGPFVASVDLKCLTRNSRKRCIILHLRDCPVNQAFFNGWLDIHRLDSCESRLIDPLEPSLVGCIISADTFCMMFDRKFAPSDWKRKANVLNPTMIKKLRFPDIDEVLPTFMHMYGQQHNVRSDLLLTKGLYAFGVDQNGTLRYYHPFEIMRLMTFPTQLVLPDVIEKAYAQIGNSIAPAHAVFAFNSVMAAEDISFYSHEQIMKKYFLPLCDLSMYRVDIEEDWMHLKPSANIAEISIACVTFNIEDILQFPWSGKSGMTIGEAMMSALPTALLQLVDAIFENDMLDNQRIDPNQRVGCQFIYITLKKINIIVEPIGIFHVHPLVQFWGVLEWISLKTNMNEDMFQARVNHLIPSAFTYVYVLADYVVRVVQHPLRGGGTTQDVKTWLAGVLENKGVPSNRVPDRTMQVIGSIGYAKLKNCMAEKDAWSSLKFLASEKGINLVRIEERMISHDKLPPPEDPWATSHKKKNKGRGKGKFQDDLGHHTTKAQVDYTFFKCSDGKPPVPLKIDEFGPHATGLVVVCHDDPLLPGLLTQIQVGKYSTDELALLIIGPVSLGSQICAIPVTVPGWVRGKPAALNGVLIQCGDVPLEMEQITSVEIKDIPKSTVIMANVYRNENSLWSTLQEHGAERYLKCVGGNDIKGSIEVWSFAYYKSGKKISLSDHDSAEYAHFVFRVPDSLLHKILRLSGNACMFLISKGSEGGRDLRFRVISTDLKEVQQVQSILLKVPEHLGIVRVNGFIGIRVEKSKYKDIKKRIHPDESTDEDIAGHADAFKYTIMNLPAGCDKVQLRGALKQASWQAQILAPNGYRTWNVISCSEPPSRSLKIDNHIAVILKQDKNEERTVVASSDRRLITKPVVIEIDKALPASSGDARNVTAPQKKMLDQMFQTVRDELKDEIRETLESQCTSKIDEIEIRLKKDIDDCQTKIKDVHDANERRFDEQAKLIQEAQKDHKRAVSQFVSGMQQIEQQMSHQQSTVQGQLDQFFSRAESFHAAQAQKSQEAFDAKLDEIMNLFTQGHDEKNRKLNDGSGTRQPSPKV